MSFYEYGLLANTLTGLAIAVGFCVAGKWWNAGVWFSYAVGSLCWIMANR